MILVIVNRHNGTFGCLGPFDNFKVAESYVDFIQDLNPKVTACAERIHFTMKNQYGVPLWPWPIDQYPDGEKG